MRTEFDDRNKSFTDAAHQAAKEQVYPHLFNDESVEVSFQSVAADGASDANWLDLQQGVDVVVDAYVPALGGTVPVYVQERFRRPKWRSEQDITITKHNHASDVPSELSKIAAQQFIYGYYEPTLDEVQEAVCVNVPVLLRAIADGDLCYDKQQNPKRQDFLTIGFDELREHGALAFHVDRTQSTSDPVIRDRRQDITAYSGGDSP